MRRTMTFLCSNQSRQPLRAATHVTESILLPRRVGQGTTQTSLSTHSILYRTSQWSHLVTEVHEQSTTAAPPPASAVVVVQPTVPPMPAHYEDVFSLSKLEDNNVGVAAGTLFSKVKVTPKKQRQKTQSFSSSAPESEAPLHFTREQANVLRLALDGASLFIGGKAGTGKSFLVREIAHRLRHTFGLRVAVTASTGVAALNIDGNTFHSTFGVPVEGAEQDLQFFSRAQGRNKGLPHHRPKSGKRITFDPEALSNADVIVIDEVSLLHAGYLEALERAARRAPGKKPAKPFGGIQLILSGDFMQLTPFNGSLQKQAQYQVNGSVNVKRDDEHIICRGVSHPEAMSADEARRADAPSTASSENDRAVGRRPSVVRRRRSVAYYRDVPLYDSYVFQHSILHVQLSHPVRQSQDKQFLSELNELRQGRLPYRLSRCAALNTPQPDAIRLYAVRTAVKTYNERQMLEVTGEELIFRSQIQLQAAATTMVPGGTNYNDQDDGEEAEGSDSSKNEKDTRAAGTPCYCSDTVLLHLNRLRLNRTFSRHRRDISESEAKAIVKDLCGTAEGNETTNTAPTMATEVLTYVMPFPVTRLLPNVTTVAVRCLGRSRRDATHKLTSLLARAQHKLAVATQCTDAPGGGPAFFSQKRNHQRTSGSGIRGAHMFPHSPHWTLLRCEAYSAQRLSVLLQPSFQQRFLRAIQHDAVLQNKMLKVGCRVMLLKNLNTHYVNGSLGTVVAFTPLSACQALLPKDLKVLLPSSHRLSAALQQRGGIQTQADAHGSPETIKLPIVRMDADGSEVAIPWVSLPLPTAAHEGFFAGKVICMPLTPAYAFTVHKIQGVTLDHPVLFNGEGMFPCDHLVYVAASRVRKFSQLRWINVSPRMISVHKPSLAFSESIPDSENASAQWECWKSAKKAAMDDSRLTQGDLVLKGGKHDKLFYPDWRSKA